MFSMAIIDFIISLNIENKQSKLNDKNAKTR